MPGERYFVLVKYVRDSERLTMADGPKGVQVMSYDEACKLVRDLIDKLGFEAFVCSFVTISSPRRE